MALALNPECDIAHHLAGRWQYEMAGLNVLVRALAQVVFGTALDGGTYEAALAAYTQARDLAPHKPIHRVELGRTLLKLGQTGPALAEFESAVGSQQLDDINAVLQQRVAAAVMQEFKRTGSIRVPP